MVRLFPYLLHRRCHAHLALHPPPWVSQLEVAALDSGDKNITNVYLTESRVETRAELTYNLTSGLQAWLWLYLFMSSRLGSPYTLDKYNRCEHIGQVRARSVSTWCYLRAADKHQHNVAVRPRAPGCRQRSWDRQRRSYVASWLPRCPTTLRRPSNLEIIMCGITTTRHKRDQI